MSKIGLEVRMKLFNVYLATELPAGNERDHEGELYVRYLATRR